MYRSPNIVRVLKPRRLRYVAKIEEGRNAFKILTVKSTAKRPLGRPRLRWEDNSSIDLKELGEI